MNFKLICLSLLTPPMLFLVTPATAGPRDRSFCYAGKRCGISIETPLFAALDAMDAAFRSSCEADRLEATRAARRHLERVATVACRPTSVDWLRAADGHLARYQRSARLYDLEAAERVVLLVLDAEQLAWGDRRHSEQVHPDAPHSGHRRPYCFQGRCHHFHGEDELIKALSLMDEALLATCHRDRVHVVNQIRRCILDARRQMCSLDAKRCLSQSLAPLARFQGTGKPCFLDDVAEKIHLALNAERAIHVRQHRVRAAHGFELTPHSQAGRGERHASRGPAARGPATGGWIRIGGFEFRLPR